MRSAAPLLFLLALGACGTGLYDAEGLPPVAPTGLVCDAGQVVCSNVCTPEDPSHCGADCVECGLTQSAPPNGQLACLPGGTCGFECLNGFLKCGDACCAATALAAGPAFTCARLDDGEVTCWGANESGQLGDGTTVGRPAPVPVPVTGAISVAAGEHHACAVVSGGVVCWGRNDAHQVSASSVSPVLAPAASPITSGATAVVAGAAHTCALVAGGAVRCWGANGAGQLGGVPAPVSGVATPIASGATAISAGSNHTCALVGGAVVCWGANGAGQLGNGSSTDPGVGVLATPIPSGMALISAFATQTCASSGVSSGGGLDDVVQCWGSGLGTIFGLAEPQTTPAIPLKQAGQSTIRFDVSRLAVGRAHACVQKTGEFLSCFGADNGSGQLGNTLLGPSEEITVGPGMIPTALAVGADHACAALAAGNVRCWGSNADGQLGDGTTVTPTAGTLAIPSGR